VIPVPVSRAQLLRIKALKDGAELTDVEYRRLLDAMGLASAREANFTQADELIGSIEVAFRDRIPKSLLVPF